MRGSYYPIPCSILSTGKDRKNFATISRCSNNIIENLYPKYGLVSRTYCNNSLIMASTFGHVNPVTRRTIDQSVGGKIRELNAKESWALLEDLALYDNESWNEPRDFAKLVKAIALP
ncbi:hypothetical protein Tco_0423797 [Tanacetum coccineum]